MKTHYDIIIVGGGPVGASLAIILAREAFEIALVEATLNNQKPENNRTLVLSYSSKMILETVKIWETLQKEATPIKDIHVSDQGHFGITRIKSSEEIIPALGYVLSAQSIAAALENLIKNTPNITMIQPASFKSFSYQNDRVQVTLEKDSQSMQLTGSLLLDTSGQNSAIRQNLKIGLQKIDYDQTAILCSVELKRSHNYMAFERFTQEGPLAFLPYQQNKSAVIWTIPTKNAQKISALTDLEFTKRLQYLFGYRLGKLQNPSQRSLTNLQLVIAKEQVRPGVVLLGNAVHTLHPVAGQGFNLALRDVAILAEELVSRRKINQVLGDIHFLKNYEQRRVKDQQKTLTLTHNLIGIFSNSLLPLVISRNAALILLDHFKSLKKLFTKQTLGFSDHAPKLACGIKLEH